MPEVAEINPAELKIAKYKALQSTLFFTRYFFKKQYNRKFVVNSHHHRVCGTLDMVIAGKLIKVIINIGPRYSKTELAVKNFIAKGLAHNAAAKFIHLSYSDDLALDNSEAIKDIVTSEAYQEMFPHVEIKPKSDSKKKWYTTEGGGVYATSTAGQVTGFGAGKVDEEEAFNEYFDTLQNEIESKQLFGGSLVLDDPIKPEDALSDMKRDRINDRWDTTIKNRVNSRRTPMVVMGQRTHPNDLCGYLMQTDGFTTSLEEALNNPTIWYVLSIPVIQEDENGNEYALWEFKHTLPELKKMQSQNPFVFGTQYMQNPQPREGLLYSPFKTYTEMPASKRRVRKSYTDTADEGSDYLCSIVYDETEFGCYVVNHPQAVIYTQDKMENTEPMTAKQFTILAVQSALIESNNGGRGFARNVNRDAILLGNTKTQVNWFHQSDNKQVRIFTKQSDVNNVVHFPAGWEKMWPVFHRHVTSYSATGKNAHDDAPDTLTGIAENFGKGGPIVPVTKEELGFY